MFNLASHLSSLVLSSPTTSGGEPKVNKQKFLQENYGTRDVNKASSMNHKLFPACQRVYDGFTKIKFPYFAPDHPPIPPWEEINEISKWRQFAHSSHKPICRIGPCVYKYGWDLRLYQEAENLIWLAENSKVRCPKAYAAWEEKDPDGDPIYILMMEYIDALCLSPSMWKATTEENKEIICRKIGEQLKLLREVKLEGKQYYGRINYQGVSSIYQIFRVYSKPVRGPYDTHDEFLTALREAMIHETALRSWEKHFFESDEERFANVKPILGASKATEPTLTHLDVKDHNILAKPIKNGTTGEIEDWEVTIIDWDTLTWMPAYLQYVSLNERFLGTWDDTEYKRIWVYTGEEPYDMENDFLHEDKDWYAFC